MRGWGLGVGKGDQQFRDLRVWQQGMDLVEQMYGVSRDFPKHECQMQGWGLGVGGWFR